MDAKPHARVLTLGCARNDVDSEELSARLQSDGWDVSGQGSAADPDVVLVNTCGFIESAKADSIEILLDAAGDGTPVVAVGCMAERYGKELAREMPDVAAVVGFDGYDSMGTTLRRVVAGEALPSHTPRDRRTLLPIAPADRPGLSRPPGHLSLPDAGTSVLRTRLERGPVASLKIASGCDRRCAFCAIPRFRGSFVSRSVDEIVAEAHWLAETGVREVVLVSENSTSYGKDLGRPRLLEEELLPGLARSVERIRVSYLQPAETRPSLLDAMTGTHHVAEYFDLSFQHASAPLLRRMRRFGGRDSFFAMVEQIRDRAPGAGVRSNVIVGFPGETEADVAQLCEFLSEARLDAVGVFGYSDEDDTEGATMGGKHDSDEIAARVAQVSSIAIRASEDRAAARVGDALRVLVEGQEDGLLRGRAEHQGPEDGETRWSGEAAVGDFAVVRAVGHDGVDLIGSPDDSIGR